MASFGAAAGPAAATSAAASAVCIKLYYVVIGGRFAPPHLKGG